MREDLSIDSESSNIPKVRAIRKNCSSKLKAQKETHKLLGRLVKNPLIDINSYESISSDIEEVALVAVNEQGRGSLIHLKFSLEKL